MKFFSTLKFRVLLSYIIVVFFALSVTAFFLDQSLEKHALSDLRSSLGIQTRLIAAQLDVARLIKEDSVYTDALVKKLAYKTSSRITIVSASGKVLGDSSLSYPEMLKMENHSGRLEIIEAASHDSASVTRRSGTLKEDMLYLAVPVRDGARLAGFVRLAMPYYSIQRMLSELRRTVALSFALSVLFALAVGWLVVLLIGRQFGEIIAGSKRFTSGDFGYRIPVGSSGELKKLSETLNYMAGAISMKMREAELRRLELEAAFRDMSEAILITDGAGVITRINPRARQLMGVSGFDAEGVRLSGMPGGPELSSAAIKALSSGRPISFEIEPAAAPGTVLSVSASPILEHGAIGGCVLVARDITGPRKLEAMRRDFVANVSHELKTPLTVIRGCAETLLNGALEDREHGPGFARSINEQAVRLDNLVNDLLKISYAESGRAQLEKTPVELKELSDDTVRGLAAILAKKKIALLNLVPAGLRVNADRDKLSQVLINLLDNAAKYNKNGGKIKISAVPEGEVVKVSVEDTGHGIPAAHLPRIFERFYRVDKARSRELGGTGLGLSIVKHLVELHGGTVGVESNEGHGSTFWFTLPKQRTA
ncbi:MAG: ATP-binding protein [Elusimicrobia bacterium]|nr:ATP-binding protein [Elusimicrobiota bacterium]